MNRNFTVDGPASHLSLSFSLSLRFSSFREILGPLRRKQLQIEELRKFLSVCACPIRSPELKQEQIESPEEYAKFRSKLVRNLAAQNRLGSVRRLKHHTPPYPWTGSNVRSSLKCMGRGLLRLPPEVLGTVCSFLDGECVLRMLDVHPLLPKLLLRPGGLQYFEMAHNLESDDAPLAPRRLRGGLFAVWSLFTLFYPVSLLRLAFSICLI